MSVKRLSIIVEGQTEREFVNYVLAPYFNRNDNVVVAPIVIRTSHNARGGFVNYDHLRNDLRLELSSKSADLTVTTLIDFFRLPSKLLKNSGAFEFSAHNRQVEAVESYMAADISDRRFVPYVQMHEFEALLFSDNRGFEVFFEKEQYASTGIVMNSFASPEDINTSPEGAPSKRLLAIKPDYNKVIDGNILALEVGIDAMLRKCGRFRRWINELEIRIK